MSDKAEVEDHDKSYSMMHQHIQVMGIANARQAAQQCERARVNLLVINMHAKNVSGIRTLINEQKFLISTTDAADGSRLVYVLELTDDLHSRLAIALSELNQAEKAIVEKAQNNMEEIETSDDVNNFLKETITSSMKESCNHEQRQQHNIIPNRQHKCHGSFLPIRMQPRRSSI